MSAHYSIGLDFGTNSARALVVDAATGQELGTSVWNYAHGEAGVDVDPRDPNHARQHPADYMTGTETAIREALAQAAQAPGFDAARVIGIGVDTTGSTPLPIDANGKPLVFQDAFKNIPAAQAWLWKDHTAHAEAAKVTQAAAATRPQYLAKCGGTYSSEWFWAKILHCKAEAPEVFDAAYTWVEIADWIPAFLCGTEHPSKLRRGVCAAGHKAMYNPAWGGYADEEFLDAVDPALARVRRSLPDRAYSIANKAGDLSPEWAAKLGLPAGIPVAVGAFDCHLGAVGCGIEPGTLVRAIGTSTCDLMVAPLGSNVPDIPGLCGIVPESVLPGMFGLEAGQSAVGDIFNWFVNQIQPTGLGHAELTAQAEAIAPGASGLLSLDWHNGNRTILIDQRLTGALLGLTLRTTPGEIYRALIEATGFGGRAIMERLEEYGVKVKRVVNCGGISVKNAMVMQIYADIFGRTMEVSRSEQTCALGSAIAGAVVAGKAAGGHATYAEATAAMTAIRPKTYAPDPARQAIYNRLYALYKRLHDGFGVKGHGDAFYDVMKELLAIRDATRG